MNTPSPPAATITRVPVEIWLMIARGLKRKELGALARTSRFLNRILPIEEILMEEREFETLLDYYLDGEVVRRLVTAPVENSRLWEDFCEFLTECTEMYEDLLDTLLEQYYGQFHELYRLEFQWWLDQEIRQIFGVLRVAHQAAIG